MIRDPRSDTRGTTSLTTTRLMVFKLVMAAAKTWRSFKGENLLPKVVAEYLLIPLCGYGRKRGRSGHSQLGLKGRSEPVQPWHGRSTAARSADAEPRPEGRADRLAVGTGRVADGAFHGLGAAAGAAEDAGQFQRAAVQGTEAEPGRHVETRRATQGQPGSQGRRPQPDGGARSGRERQGGRMPTLRHGPGRGGPSSPQPLRQDRIAAGPPHGDARGTLRRAVLVLRAARPWRQFPRGWRRARPLARASWRWRSTCASLTPSATDACAACSSTCSASPSAKARSTPCSAAPSPPSTTPRRPSWPDCAGRGSYARTRQA